MRDCMTFMCDCSARGNMRSCQKPSMCVLTFIANMRLALLVLTIRVSCKAEDRWCHPLPYSQLHARQSEWPYTLRTYSYTSLGRIILRFMRMWSSPFWVFCSVVFYTFLRFYTVQIYTFLRFSARVLTEKHKIFDYFKSFWPQYDLFSSYFPNCRITRVSGCHNVCSTSSVPFPFCQS